MNKRDMFYQNYGGYVEPQMYPNMMQQPQGINPNFGQIAPNSVPYQNQTNTQNYYPDNDFEARISKLERQIRSLDARVSKLETSVNLDEEIISDTYMI